MSNYHRAFEDADLVLEMKGEPWMPFRLIPACPEGFWMGSRGEDEWAVGLEQPRHKVVLTESFYMGSFPVTQEQYSTFRPEHASQVRGKPQNPVENVSWDDAMAICEWLNKEKAKWLKAFDTVYGQACFGLPTEAEWEYACRADTDTEYWSGDGEAALEEVGWYDEHWDTGSTHPVCDKAANDFGLYDMHGNVLEWCQDGWDGSAYRKRASVSVDPYVNPDKCKDRSCRVLRGGSWDSPAASCRSACRVGLRAGFRYGYYGFRLCLFPGPSSQQSAERLERIRRRPEGYDDQKAESRRGAGRRRDAGAKATNGDAAGAILGDAHGPKISK